jgi:hypothetical protein
MKMNVMDRDMDDDVAAYLDGDVATGIIIATQFVIF